MVNGYLLTVNRKMANLLIMSGHLQKQAADNK
ncbi:hypothetical protein FHS57_002706 [Runella defluvii]|uniref:Uncharacterized protein n=1 Tax=Runella defluvii TaxID=370973 RepID=A0A7W5ZK96_9BACT|nr:hypothetical protein [Runella defluvii]